MYHVYTDCILPGRPCGCASPRLIYQAVWFLCATASPLLMLPHRLTVYRLHICQCIRVRISGEPESHHCHW